MLRLLATILLCLVTATVSAQDFFMGAPLGTDDGFGEFFMGDRSVQKMVKPELTVFAPSYCPPCPGKVQQLESLNAFDLKVKTEYNWYPAWVNERAEQVGFPLLYWQVGDKYYSSAWREPEELLELYYNPNKKLPSDTETEPKKTEPKLPPAGSLVPVNTYPTHPQRWNINGVWNVSTAELKRHLLQDSFHRGRFSEAYLNSLSRAQLLSLHDDHHEGRVRVPQTQQPAATIRLQTQPAKILRSINCPTCPR